MNNHKTYSVTANDVDMRLDRFIRHHIPGTQQSVIEKLLRKAAIKVNGKKAKSSYRLQPNDEISLPTIQAGAAAPPRATPNPALVKLINDCVIYEDEELIAINKPAGVPVQGGNKVKNHIDAILQYLRPEGELRIVHRIDKDTSGILLIAKNRPAAQWLTKGFKDKLFTKTYHAIVVGKPPSKHGIIKATIEKRPGRLGEKMEVVADNPDDMAITKYTVLDSKKGFSLLELTPITGRTHQIRVHCAHIGCPILGDGKYGGKAAHPLGKRFQLHLSASAITIVYPDGHKQTITVNLPRYFVDSLRFLNLKK